MKYLVWEVEYPEDGSTEVEAESKEEAIKKHRDNLQTGDLEDYDACELTPEIEAKLKASEEK
jgi:hypothetical protein